MNPPPQEYPSTMVEDSEDAAAEAASDVAPKRIVQPLSKSATSRGPDFMDEDESEASAGSVETDWPGTKEEFPFVGAPKGFPKTHDEQADDASAGAGGESEQVAAAAESSETSDDAAAAAGGGGGGGGGQEPTAAAAAHGAPALLKNLQAVILNADESKTEYTELQRKLNALNR